MNLNPGDRVYHTEWHEYATVISKEDDGRRVSYRIKYDGKDQVYSTKQFWLIKVEDGE